MKSAIQKSHQAAYRCRNSEETRQFYEDFLVLSLVDAFEINLTATASIRTSALFEISKAPAGSGQVVGLDTKTQTLM